MIRVARVFAMTCSFKFGTILGGNDSYRIKIEVYKMIKFCFKTLLLYISILSPLLYGESSDTTALHIGSRLEPFVDTYLIDKMKGQDIYAHVTLEKGERSHLAELASDLL